jgi:predicted Fe-Mo cluster-binding NifX family protein
MHLHTQETVLKIAISSDKPDLEARVGNGLGTSKYLMVVDLRTMAVEAVANSGASGHGSGGIQAVVLVITKKVNAVLTGYCSPTAEKYLTANGIEVLTGVKGTVVEVVRQYKNGDLQKHIGVVRNSESRGPRVDRVTVFQALKTSFNQLITLLPMLVGTVLLVGLFKAFASKELLTYLFSGNDGLDTLWGACFGSVFAGNPINSYIIGGELLEYGVSLYAVTALIIAWVTVGVVQLPAEINALGTRFAFVRNAISFALSLTIAFATVGFLNLITG